MGAVIKARTISSVVDNRIQVSNAKFARGFTPPSGWTRLRLAFRFCFTDLGTDAPSAPGFVFGFCSGNTNIYADATTDHFVGWIAGATAWTRHGTYGYNDGSSVANFTFQPFKRIGTTNTNGSGTQV